MFCPVAPRPRNAEATRAAILTAARERFARESYDDVGMRDIAGDVGVDAALISRYFGSKEDLFGAVLESCENGSTLLEGPRAEWGARVAREVVFKVKDQNKLTGLLILLRSVGSAKAAELVQRGAHDRFFGPFEAWVGGPDAAIRARLAAGLVMGMSISRELNAGDSLTPEQCEQLSARLGAILQNIIDG